MAGRAGDVLSEPTLCHKGKLTSSTQLWAVQMSVLSQGRKGRSSLQTKGHDKSIESPPKVLLSDWYSHIESNLAADPQLWQSISALGILH